ncbi:MAG TPA: hypothetical protein QF624_02565 [Dehalococcoidia bacterium]|nr:hypothetical protein [Dehalococcoidia bacterium]
MATATRTAVPGCSPGPSAPPAIYYGFELAEGAVVTTFNSTRPGCEDIVCERSTVDDGGFWIVRIAGDSICGVRNGDTIIFKIGEEFSAHEETWVAGGVPADVAQGIALRE